MSFTALSAYRSFRFFFTSWACVFPDPTDGYKPVHGNTGIYVISPLSSAKETMKMFLQFITLSVIPIKALKKVTVNVG
jgi:hypothetical protein